MQALFEIRKCFPHVHKARPFGEVRQYFIAAEEEVWDYAPTLPTEGSVTAHGICMHCVLKWRWQHMEMMFVFSYLAQRSRGVCHQRQGPHRESLQEGSLRRIYRRHLYGEDVTQSC